MACAEARDALIELAGKRLDWSSDELSPQNGDIYAPGFRKVSYGELAGELDLRREATGKVPVRPIACTNWSARRCRAAIFQAR